ncbi:hypothetical protein ABZ863_17505 [Saccharomonospora sp. NPDC046836]
MGPMRRLREASKQIERIVREEVDEPRRKAEQSRRQAGSPRRPS